MGLGYAVSTDGLNWAIAPDSLLNGRIVLASTRTAGTGVRSSCHRDTAFEATHLRPPHGGYPPIVLFLLATAAFAFCGGAGTTAEIRASGTLLSRRSPALLDALERAGVSLRLLHDDAERRGWPLAVTAVEPPEEVVLEHPESSQEASGTSSPLPAASAMVIRFHCGSSGVPREQQLRWAGAVAGLLKAAA